MKLLRNHGVSKAVISPGSRNAPIIRALIEEPEIQTFLLADERSAAFVAMGMALQDKQPAIVCCTSGTAAINLYPAICEAWYANIPLIAITADRPQELIDQWDGQCIHQQNLYEPHIGASLSFDTSRHFYENLKNANSLIADCLQKPKPLHLNIALSEPLYEASYGPFMTESSLRVDLPDNKNTPSDQAPLPVVKPYKKVMVVYGAHTDGSVNQHWPEGTVVLSDLISGKRELQNVPAWDAILTSKDESTKRELLPDLLITCGMYVLSKELKKLLRSSSAYEHIHIDHGQGFGNMFDNHATIIPTNNPTRLLNNLSKKVAPELSFLQKWKHMSEAVLKHRKAYLASGWSDWHAVQYVSSQINDNSLLHVANSMPVRYLSLLDTVDQKTKIHCNRGTSGIDGCTSTALGASLCVNSLTYLITGDVAFFYDLNALWNDHLHPNFKIILLNNGGGNIFSMIDGPEKFPEGLHYQESPHNRTAGEVAPSLGMAYFKASDSSELHESWKRFNEEKERAAILEIFTNKSNNIAFYQQLKQFTS